MRIFNESRSLTSSRADYGIYQPLLTKLKADARFNMEIIAFGMHLQKKQGNTIEDIQKDHEAELLNIDNHFGLLGMTLYKKEIELRKSLKKTNAKKIDILTAQAQNLKRYHDFLQKVLAILFFVFIFIFFIFFTQPADERNVRKLIERSVSGARYSLVKK